MKKTIDWIYNLIGNKRVRIFAFVVGTFIIFRIPIDRLSSFILIDPILSKVQSSLLIDILAFVVVLSSIIICYKKFGTYTPSKNILVSLLSLIVIYIGQRIFFKEWIFKPFYLINWLKYADLIILLTGVNALLLIPHKKINSDAGTGNLVADEPIKNSSQDRLGFSQYANQIAAIIKSTDFPESFAFGINGAWGSGKTSFLNILKFKLEPKDLLIEVDFNCWNSLTPEAIVKDFFDTMQERIKPFHSTVARKMKIYADKLIELSRNPVSQSIHAFVNALTGLDSSKHMQDGINDTLRDLDRKIVVYIDDLDRLNKEEIFQVMRLVRNTANFYKTFFIVTYDRNYIIDALDKNDIFNSEQFVEKIFQLEITLPHYNKNIIRNSLHEKIISGVPQKFHQALRDIIIGSSNSARIDIENMVTNMRDVTRLANSFCLNSFSLLGDVDLRDFLKVEMLRYKYPSVYLLLASRTKMFLTTKNNQNIQVYILATVNDSVTGQPSSDKALKVYLEENHELHSVPKNEIDIVINFMKSIFPEQLIMPQFKSVLSIIYPDKFSRYFAYKLMDDELSEIEFAEGRTKSQEIFNACIIDWCEKGLTWEVAKKFNDISNYDDRDDFEKVIRGMFYLGNIIFTGENYPLGFDFKNLIEKLVNYNDSVVNKYYYSQDGELVYHSFLLSLFKGANLPFYFESELISVIFTARDQQQYFPLSPEELSTISIQYFRNYLDSVSSIDMHVFTLFWHTRYIKFKSGEHGALIQEEIVPEESKDLMKKFILQKDVHGFMAWIIEENFPGQSFFRISPTADRIFEGWGNFDRELIEILNSQDLYEEEFLQFYNAYKNEEYKKYVKFDFKIIPVFRIR